MTRSALVVVVVADAQQEVDWRGLVGAAEDAIRGRALVHTREAHLIATTTRHALSVANSNNNQPRSR